MTRFELEILTVGALRKLARQDDKIKQTYSGVEISNMGKEMLVRELSACHNLDTDPVVQPDRPADPVQVTEPVTTEASSKTREAAETLAQIQSIIGKPGADMAEVETLIASKLGLMCESLLEELASKEHVTDLHRETLQYVQAKIELLKVPRRVEIVIPDMPVVDAGIQHECFPRLVQLAQLRMNVLLVGPAGSGKTFAAEELAKALKLNYEALSVGPMTMPSALFGYDDSKGVYHETGLVRCYRDGGVMLLDELDAGNAGILTGINMATSNGVMSTPAGMIKKHADFILIAGANTFGTGASAEYVGRNPLCKSTMDRFKKLEWNYDQSFEMHLAGPETEQEKDYIALVQRMRATAEELGIKVIISPRASIDGIKMLRANIPFEDCLQLSVFAGLDTATISKLRG